MRTRHAVPAAIALLLGACSYDYSNPAERLDGGEVTGRVVADSGGGAAGLGGVDVWLRNSSSIQTTRDNGRFVLLGLMPGRHTVLFEKRDGGGNATWAGSREVEVAWGSDGQPEGVILGDITVRYPVTITGTVSVPTAPGAFYPQAVFAYDDATGMGGLFQDGLDLSGTSPTSDFTYTFRGLGVGPHLLRFAVIGLEYGWPAVYLVGPISKDVSSAQEGQTVPMSQLTMVSSLGGSGKLRFKVAAPPSLTGAYAVAATVTDETTLAVQTCSTYSDGTRECDVATGAYRIDVVTTPSDGTFLDPPPAIGIVNDGQTTDLGTLYVIDYATASEAANACVYDVDCPTGMACDGGQCVFSLPACFSGDFSAECAGWDLQCFQPPYLPTSCNGGRGTCALGLVGPGGYACVPSGASGCLEGGGEPYPIQPPECSLLP